MTKEAELHKIVREELGHRGYIVSVHTQRKGEFVVGRLQVTSAETDESVAKFVGVGQIDDLGWCFGIDAQGALRDAIVKTLGAWEGVQSLMPTFVVKTPKP